MIEWRSSNAMPEELYDRLMAAERKKRAAATRRTEAQADGCVKCGKPRFYDEPYCEDCWANNQLRYHGMSQRAKLEDTEGGGDG